MNSTHNCGDPLHLSGDELRLILEGLSLREQPIDILNTVLICVSKERFLERTAGLTISQNCLNLRMSQLSLIFRTLVLIRTIKYVVLHFFFSFIICFFCTALFCGNTYKVHHNFLLLFCHSINDILNSLFLTGIFGHLLFLLLIFRISMLDNFFIFIFIFVCVFY